MASPLYLIGKSVLVTGATGALGRVVVKRLLAAGADVAAVHRDEEKLRELRDFAGGTPGALDGFKADVGSEAEIAAMVQSVLVRYGRIDALLNLAGGYRGGTGIAETPEADWDLMIRTNLKSAFLCSRAVLPAMLKAGRGRIVNVAARPAVESKGRARSGAYAVSKAGVVALTLTIAEETRTTGITANCVVPGTIDTPENRAAIPGGDPAKWAAPDAIADVLLFIVSDASSVISGAVIPVYGRS